MIFYPQGDAVLRMPTIPFRCRRMSGGHHRRQIIFWARHWLSDQVTLSDIGVTIPVGACHIAQRTGSDPRPGAELEPLTLSHTLAQAATHKVNGAAVSAAQPDCCLAELQRGVHHLQRRPEQQQRRAALLSAGSGRPGHGGLRSRWRMEPLQSPRRWPAHSLPTTRCSLFRRRATT